MKITTKAAITKFKGAHKLASDILAGAHAGLPDDHAVHHLATQLFVHGIESTDASGPKGVDHGGVSRDQDGMLRSSFDEADRDSN